MKPTEKVTSRPACGSESKASELCGEAHALIEQIGSRETLAPLGEVLASLRLDGVKGVEGLKRFLETYESQVLSACEFPAISIAHGHASRGEIRELMDLDQQLTRIPGLQVFARASQQIGRLQLKRMRPMRDQRVVQRYLAALEAGKALAWHPIVYGVTLAVYSMPLRQGLVHYAEETLTGLAYSAARTHRFRESECREVLGPIFARLPAAIEKQVAFKPGRRQQLKNG